VVGKLVYLHAKYGSTGKHMGVYRFWWLKLHGCTVLNGCNLNATHCELSLLISRDTHVVLNSHR